jgi:hypothetical protein
MRLAAGCGCAQGPREFDRGWCHRCGRQVDVLPFATDEEAALTGWELLNRDVLKTQVKMRRRFERETGLVWYRAPVEYEAWLLRRQSLAPADRVAVAQL